MPKFSAKESIKKIKMNKNEQTIVASTDKHSLVYLTFVLLGIGTLLPWNFFISVSAYWNFKYRTINETFDEFEVSGHAIFILLAFYSHRSM